MDIKQEDLIRFWTWVGFYKLPQPEWQQYPPRYLRYVYPNGNKMSLLPKLDLNSLYKYAIPKLQKEGIIIELSPVRYKGFTAKTINANGYSSLALKVYDTPTEALYNAILKVIDLDK